MLRMEVRQCTLAGLADPARRADGVDDIGFGHGLVPCGQAGIRLKGTPLSGRWSCGRPRIFSAIVFSSIERKSVVEGKSVSVRVDLGGRRILKKKNVQGT